MITDIEKEIQNKCQNLQIPNYLKDDNYETDAELLQKATLFALRSKSIFEDIRKLFKDIKNKNDEEDGKVEIVIADKILQDLVYTCCTFISAKESWADSELKNKANFVLESITSLDPKRFPSVSRLVQIFAIKILERFVKPCFLQNSEFNKTGSKVKKSREKTANSIDESKRLDISLAASALEWIVVQIQHPELDTMIGLIIPPMLTLIDDYSVKFKIQGTSILDHLLKQVKPTIIQRMGLGSIFFEALIACLTYQSEEKYIPLLRTSFSAILNLIPLIESSNLKEQHAKFEKVLFDHIIRGIIFADDRLSIRKILLEQVPPFTDALGIVAVKYLKHLIPAISNILEIPLDIPGNKRILELHITAAIAFEHIITTCWPRIPRYEGPILKAIVTSWSQTIAFEKNEKPTDNSIKLKETLQNLCRLLSFACNNHPNFQNDCQVLQKLDPDVFNPLFDHICLER
ncbi:13411_t:CDS:2 [Ambispora gerdemannii]|uniref:13411_t:CDS:1 n=1 Tax=Ambispora gerdemannii TaxID=144530 RepID=A0A9N8Z755_9GLOM|nr:13411_t:CDS:2 [Ambispora gerdemannii]